MIIIEKDGIAKIETDEGWVVHTPDLTVPDFVDDAWLAEVAAVAYKIKRKNEYPSIEDQLDDIYHNGIDAWKATIKVTKDKYPKG
jgi:hypothetical protein